MQQKSFLELPKTIIAKAAITVGASSKSTVVALVDKKSKYVYFHKIPNKKAVTMKYAILFLLRKIPQSCLKSITYDNGSENVLHHEVNSRLGTRSYFCAPYHAWEKGLVENTIGLLRQYFPKKTNFDTITDEQITNVQQLINNRPRKSLGFKTPAEVFSVALNH